MTPAEVRKLVADSIEAALVVEREAVAARAAEAASRTETAGVAGMAANGTNGRKCTYKDFKSGDPTVSVYIFRK